MTSNSAIFSPLFNPVYALPEDFTIFVDNQPYYCHKMVVFSLSNTIMNEAIKNPNLSTFIIQKDLISDPNHYFKLVNDYFHGKDITSQLTSQNVLFIMYISQYLFIQQLYEVAASYNQKTTPNLTKDNALDVMKQYSCNKIPNESCEKLIAENWEYYSQKPEILDLPVFAFKRIITSDYFNIQNEAELFSFIKKLSLKSNEYTSLFSLCFPDKLQQDNIEDIISLCEYDNIDSDIIQLLIDIIDPSTNTDNKEDNYPSNFIQQNNQPPQDIEPQFQVSQQSQSNNIPSPTSGFGNAVIMAPYFETNELEISPGIFSFFKNQFGHRISSIITLDGGGTNSQALRNIMEYGQNTFKTYWDNSDGNKYTQSNAYLIITFNGYKIDLQDFTLCCSVAHQNSYQPKSISVQGAINDTWTPIKTIPNCNANNYNPKLNIKISSGGRSFSKFKFTLSSTYASNDADRFHFNISALELYGCIFPIN